MSQNRDIYVFAGWHEFDEPAPLGVLHFSHIKGKEIFSFEYDPQWLSNRDSLLLDPDLLPYVGYQYVRPEAVNFGLFLDSAPDRWGRLLMKRREAILAREQNRKPNVLTETDYLLGVFDLNRMGGIRLKIDPNGDFLDNNRELAAPPWTNIRDLEYASIQLEKDDSIDDPEYRKWLMMLINPGSSLGGARPKANVVDKDGNLWIAKFPSGSDTKDMGAWEKVVNELAAKCGIWLPKSKAQIFSCKQHTFLSKRFDRRADGSRIHFASAMTMLGERDGADHTTGSSYLDMVAFISRAGANVDENLEQLFRRIVFNVAVSNCDDHLRNHGFLMTQKGWVLSPAYDINPDENGVGLKLNISENDNSLDYGLVASVAKHFRLSPDKSDEMISRTKKVVSTWSKFATMYGISRSEQEMMSTSFRY